VLITNDEISKSIAIETLLFTFPSANSPPH
jgi:hypothetical protein